MTASIKIWGNSSSCQNCILAKEYFDALGVDYDYYDLSSVDPAKRIEYKKQLMAKKISYIPYIEIKGQEPMVGFDKNKLDEIFKK